MPTMHIPEDPWSKLLVEFDGDMDAAREAVKEAVRERANDGQ